MLLKYTPAGWRLSNLLGIRLDRLLTLYPSACSVDMAGRLLPQRTSSNRPSIKDWINETEVWEITFAALHTVHARAPLMTGGLLGPDARGQYRGRAL